MASATAIRSQSGERIHTAVPEQHGRAMRSELCADLSWYLGCGSAAMSERGTLAGVICALEHGGHGGGTPNTDLYSDEQVGWGRSVYGSVEKHRWLTSAWNALTPETQGVLLARYAPSPAEFRSDEGFGARDRFVEGSDSGVGKHRQVRTGVEAGLGEYACLAILLCSDPGKLLIACREGAPTKANRAGLVVVDRELQKQRSKVRGEALVAARRASEKAHAEWSESKAGADPMRTRNQRVKVGAVHVPGGR